MMGDIVNVYYLDRLVGYLKERSDDHLVFFEYDEDWLEHGFSISPISLPLKKGVFIPRNRVFNGLFGVFSDSLPDAWGRLLIARMLREKGIDNSSELFKLSLVGPLSMGALTYKPSYEYLVNKNVIDDYDALSLECQKILDNKDSIHLDYLFKIGGSSGGARPKANITIGNDTYILKFNTRLDGKNVGKMEYDYSLCARECGIDIPDTKLLPSKECDGYFAIKRFDIVNGTKKHMVSAAGLLEYDFNSPGLDYSELMKLTRLLTDKNENDVLQLFKRMCFNVYAHNQDDHGKNFSYLYNEEENRWHLSPAYDLTYSTTYFGEHTTSVNGKGRNILDSDLVTVGLIGKLDLDVINKEIKFIKDSVNKCLGKYLK